MTGQKGERFWRNSIQGFSDDSGRFSTIGAASIVKAIKYRPLSFHFKPSPNPFSFSPKPYCSGKPKEGISPLSVLIARRGRKREQQDAGWLP